MKAYTDTTDAPAFGTPWPEIQRTILLRSRQQNDLVRSWHDIATRYNGDWVLPEFADYGDLAPALVHDTIEHLGMTAAQPEFLAMTPAAKPGTTYQEKAGRRRRAVQHTIRESRLALAQARFYRQLAAYGSGAMIAWPDLKNEVMRVQVRDAITTYPEPKDPADFTPPANIGFVWGQSAGWLRSHYPKVRQELGGCIPQSANYDETWDVVQWWDEEAMVLGVLGPRWRRDPHGEVPGGGYELGRIVNRMGMCPGIAPWTITLDKVISHLQLILGKTDLLARFTALDMIQSEKAIFPDRYMIGNGPGMVPKVNNQGGIWPDGRSGEVAQLTDTAAVGELRGTPDPSGKIARDYIERNARATAGLVAPFQGETYGALRTGRGIESLLEASVDPRMYEMHKIGEWAFSHVLTACMAGYKGYFGTKTFSLYSGLEGDTLVEFQPERDVDTTKVECVYPVPGTDIQGSSIILGQALAAEGISKQDYRARHPWIRDDGTVEQKLLVEGLKTAAMQSLTQRFLEGIHPEDQAKLIELAEKGKAIAELITEANRLAQERQAQEAPPAPEGFAAPPQTMPGLGNPGEGGEMQEMAPAIAGPNDSQANLKSLMLALKASPPPAVQPR